MAELKIQYPDDLLAASGKPRSEIETELRFQLAVRLFQVGQLSLGKAADLVGMNRLRFADELGRMKIPVVNLDDEEIEAELRAIRGDLISPQYTRRTKTEDSSRIVSVWVWLHSGMLALIRQYRILIRSERNRP